VSPRLSVIVPVYDEAARLGPALARLSAFLRKHAPGAHELLVVDDGSRDATPALLARLRLPGLRVLRLPRNRGKGAAVRAGLGAARGRAILFMDCDLSTPPAEIPGAERLIRAGWDVAIGSRALPASRLPVPQPPLRRLAGRLFNLATRILLGLPFADTQCGFKAFSPRAARRLAREGRVDGFAFDCELLLLARRAGFRVRDFPVTWSDRAHSTVRLFRHTPRMFSTLLALQRRFHAVIPYHPARALPLILASVAGAFCGQVAYKIGARALGPLPLGAGLLVAMLHSPWIWAGFSCFGASAFTWLLALARVDLSFAFPLLSLNFVFTALVSRFWFGEILPAARVAGITLVVAGVLVIAVSARPPSHEEPARA
jgi:glycosyltransferase involved in cell wall biosynthesis/multidrug transporter EmrE-like cation transporter